MTDLTRRAFLAGAAALPVVAAIGPADAEITRIVALPAPSGAMGIKAYAAMLSERIAMPAMHDAANLAAFSRAFDMKRALLAVTSIGYTNGDGEWVEMPNA